MTNISKLNTLFVSVILILLTACNAKPKVGVLGERIDYKGYALTVTQIKSADDFPGARKARIGNKLVAIEVKVESGANKGVSFSPKHAILVDRNGKEYSAHTSGMKPVMEEVYDIPKGQSRSGWLTYEVPDGSRKFMFIKELPQAFSNTEIKYELELK